MSSVQARSEVHGALGMALCPAEGCPFTLALFMLSQPIRPKFTLGRFDHWEGLN